MSRDQSSAHATSGTGVGGPASARDPWIALSILVVAGVTGCHLWGDPAWVRADRATFCFYAVFLLLAGGATGQRFKRASLRAERRFWGLVTAGLGAWLLADLYFLLPDDETYRHLFFQSLQDLAYLSYYLLVLIAAEQRPELAPDRLGRDLDRRLELTGISLFAVGLLFYFILVPNATAPELDEEGITLGSYLLYLVLDGYLALRFLYLRRRFPHGGWARIYAPLALGHLAWVGTDLLELLGRLPGARFAVPLALSPLWYLPFLAWVVAARRRAAWSDQEQAAASNPPVPATRRRRLVVLLVVLIVLHLVVGLVEGADQESYGLRGVAVLLVGLALGGLSQLQLRLLDTRSRRLLAERERALADLRSSEEALRTRNELLRTFNERLAERVRERTVQVRQTRDIALLTLARLTESRDHETGRHLERIARFSETLARELVAGAWHGRMSADFPDELARSSPLHDIGKVGIPDAILLKPGPLTEAEREVMRTHTTLGGDTLRSILDEHGGEGFLRMAMEIAYAHHERWDGSGYPAGLAGEEIPAAARIVALADAYDAITSARPYKGAFPHATAVERIVLDRGRHFDPTVVDAFLVCAEGFPALREALEDEPPPAERIGLGSP